MYLFYHYCRGIVYKICDKLYFRHFLANSCLALTVQQLKNVYKITQNNLPASFNSFLIRRQHSIHEHLTRNRHMLVTAKVHHKFAETCIVYSVFKTVNDTPTQIIDKMYTHSLHGVANYSKNLLINEYDERCCTRDCYICK